MMARLRIKAKGFTLLEVLVALSVAAIALAAVSRLIGLYVNDSAAVQERVVGYWVAQNILAETQLTDPWPELESTKGELEYMGRTWQWRRLVEETPFETVRRTEIQVFSDEGSDDYVSRTSGYLGEKTKW